MQGDYLINMCMKSKWNPYQSMPNMEGVMVSQQKKKSDSRLNTFQEGEDNVRMVITNAIKITVDTI